MTRRLECRHCGAMNHPGNPCRCLGNIMKDKPTCPKCKVLMTRRKGRYGDFYGCVNYPDCDVTTTKRYVVGLNDAVVFKDNTVSGHFNTCKG